MEASGQADSPQLSRLRHTAVTLQDCSAFSLVCSHAADEALTQAEKCAVAIRSLAENYIVFDAKPTRLNQKKKLIFK